MKHSGSAATVAQKMNTTRECKKALKQLGIAYAHADLHKSVSFWVREHKVYLYPASARWHVRNSAFGNTHIRGIGLESLKQFIEKGQE